MKFEDLTPAPLESFQDVRFQEETFDMDVALR